MHHFPTRNDLFTQLVARCVDRVWAEVLADVDHSEPRPGRFTRAYVRTLTGNGPLVTEAFSLTGLLSRIGHEPVMAHLPQLAPNDAAKWNEAFAQDGSPHVQVLVIRNEAEGLAVSINTSYATPEQVRYARRALLAMTETPRTHDGLDPD